MASESEPNVWRSRLGRFGVWRSNRIADPSVAPVLEGLGFGALWMGGAPGDLRSAEAALEATSTLVVATGIVNIWEDPPESVSAAFHRVSEAHPGRFLLGIGVGHPEQAGAGAARPFEALVRYLDVLDAEGVPAADRVIAALGPRMLRLSGERAAGAHPYLVTPGHTHDARALLGPGPLLAPEQRVVMLADPDQARVIGRPTVQTPYLGFTNYRNNLLRLGYAERELDDGGSDRLIDDLVASGDSATIAGRLGAHLDAGADHIAVQLVGTPPRTDEYAELAAALGLAPR
ncbi:MAG TPA: LLM class F420-dependent oxidoreductase [Pseudolysinimonas sp.]|jgi:probable F420-dependent oxidoreductase